MATSPAGLIGGVYSIDFARGLEGAAPPASAFAASAGGQGGFMAVQVARGWPARARALHAMTGSPVRNLLSPLAHGPATAPGDDTGYFVICQAPPGPSLEAAPRPWTETELLEDLVKPAAQMLSDLQGRGVTHRAIRPGNMFQPTKGTAVSFGCAWAAPPACRQPAWLEPPSSAACLPAGRGNGTIADDVYALGAVLLMLALGRNPVDGVPEEAILRRKLDIGSFAALAGDHRLPPALADLLRGMLADDPDHRPSPALLATPAAARARRIAARPLRRAQRAIDIGAHSAATTRTLAYALQCEPAAGLSALRNGMVDRWLRRLGDTVAAGQLDEAMRLRDAQAAAGDAKADPALIANAVALLDPAAPLVWRSLAVWPDGLGAALDHALHHQPQHAATLAEIVTANVAETWAARRDLGREKATARLETRDLGGARKDRRGSMAHWRLCYSLNPLSPCESPLLGRSWVTRLPELLPAMEAAAATRLPDGQTLLDDQIVAFIAARRDERLQADIGRLAAELSSGETLAQLQLLGKLQAKLHPAGLPNLCAWAADALQPHIARFSSRARRTRLAAETATLAKAGQLPPIAALLESDVERQADHAGCEAARIRLAEIEQVLAQIAGAEPGRTDQAQRAGQEVAGGIGVVASLVALAAAVFA